jgi:Carboxypeptidase regulatory-like domain
MLCTKTNTGPANACTGSNASVCGFFAMGKCDPMPSLIGALPIFQNEINAVSVLTNTRISFGLNVVGFGGLPCSKEDLSSGNCWYGIVGVWIGGQGVQTAGCTGSNSCSFGVTGQPHAQLPIFQDSQLTRAATIPPVDQLVNLAQLTNQTMSNVIATNTYSQVFTYVDTQNLGVQYASTPASCTIDSLSQCFDTPPPLIVNIPIVYDIIGSQSLATWLYKYPGIPPNGGTTSGFVSGRVIDTSTKNLFGQYSPLVGACIGVGGPCSGQPGQIQESTDTDGRFTLDNIPPGTYTIWATYPGYSNIFRSNVIVSVGATTVINFAMSPVSAPGMLCLIPPIANPLPFQAPIFGGLCIPNWALWATGSVIAGLSFIFAWSYTAPARAAAGSISSIRKKTPQ